MNTILKLCAIKSTFFSMVHINKKNKQAGIKPVYWNEFTNWNKRKKYRTWFLPTSEISSCGISHGKIISVNWLLCYRFFQYFEISNSLFFYISFLMETAPYLFQLALKFYRNPYIYTIVVIQGWGLKPTSVQVID